MLLRCLTIVTFVTTAKSANGGTVLEYLLLQDRFDTVVTGGDVMKTRLAPASFLLSLNRLSAHALKAFASEGTKTSQRSATASEIHGLRIGADGI
jgi:beta-phosphoglucomutase-like phosphatase (HAD superfamily)